MFELARKHHVAGRHAEAEVVYRALLHDRDDHLGAWGNLGDLYVETGRWPEAADAFRHAVSLDRRDASMVMALANALAMSGDLEQAEAVTRQALAMRPNHVNMLSRMLELLHRPGHYAEGVAFGLRAVELEPERAALRWLVGETLIALARNEEAVVQLEAATRLDPDEGKHWHALGNAYFQSGRIDEACSAYVRAAALSPENPRPLLALGTALSFQGEVRGADDCFGRAAAMGDPAGVLRSAMLLPPIAESVEDILEWRSRYEAKLDALLASDIHTDDPAGDVAVTSFTLTYHGYDNRGLQEKLARVMLKVAPSLDWTAPHCLPGAAPRSGDGRIRIGFLSWYLKRHTIGKVNAGIIEHFDRDRFEVVVIQGIQEDDESRAIAASADRAIKLDGDLDTMRRRIAELELDALLYTDIGMEPMGYYLAFSRLAPVQAVTWGHPETSGLPSIDYYISSDLVDDADAGGLYSEKLVRLTGMPAYYRFPTIPEGLPGREALPFEDDWVVYACVQSLFKVHPEFDHLMGEILRRDPRGRVVLVDHPVSAQLAERFNDRLERNLPDVVDRIVFLPRLSTTGYFTLLSAADVLLDTIHFGGGSTTYESFAVGAPVVTWPRRFARSRVTAGAYARMGMPDEVAHSAEEYVERAVSIANDHERRDDLRRRIVEARGVLYEDIGAVREMEAFFEDAVARARSS